MKQVTAWQCEGCGELIRYKRAAGMHEKRCTLNPANKACQTCMHVKESPLGLQFQLGCNINAIGIGRRHMVNCPSWQAKEGK